MAWSSACRTFFQNLFFGGKDKLVGAAPFKGNNTCTMLCTPTPTASVALPVVFALSFIVRYLEDDLQPIFNTVLEFRPCVSPLTFALAFLQYKSPSEKPLKAWFSDAYWDKTHLKYYNYLQQYEDHFATAGAKG